MELQTIKAGTRRIQKVTGGHAINIPMVLVESFDLKQGDKFDISATTDGTITLKQVIE
jgi:antitoxin component of MazEF toxin-antitoxin module